MRNLIKAMILAPLLMAAAPALASTLTAVVDVSEQRMRVYEGDRLLHDWPVSTARKGKVTPRGNYSPQWLSKNHKSSRYNNAPMPNAIFYSGHYAIHGTYDTGKLGRPASSGCVRLSIENSARLFDHVRRNGKSSLRIRVKD